MVLTRLGQYAALNTVSRVRIGAQVIKQATMDETTKHNSHEDRCVKRKKVRQLVKTASRHSVPEEQEDLKVGSKMWLTEDNGEPLQATVTQLSGPEVTLDANKPLAAKTLVFDIERIKFL